MIYRRIIYSVVTLAKFWIKKSRVESALNNILSPFKGVNLQIIIVFGAQNGNINFRLPSWTVSVYWDLNGS